VRQENVAAGQVRVCVKRDGADLVLPREGRAIQRLDVRENVLELESVRRNQAAGHAIEHEGVVGIRAVGDADFHRAHASSSGSDGAYGRATRFTTMVRPNVTSTIDAARPM